MIQKFEFCNTDFEGAYLIKPFCATDLRGAFIKDYSKEGKEEGGEKVDLNSKKYEVVNINKATQTELETLPGIGPSLALKIINYRKENGEFSSIEELKNISGIGDSKFEEIKKYITI